VAVFFQAYTLYFLAQLGPDYEFIAPPAAVEGPGADAGLKEPRP
jgi:hypothetical protein